MGATNDQKRAPELTAEVEEKLVEVDEKLETIDKTLDEVRKALANHRDSLRRFYAIEATQAKAARQGESNDKR